MSKALAGPAATPRLSPPPQPLNWQRVQAISMAGIFVLLVFYTLFFLRGFILPVLIAMMLHAVLDPAVVSLRRLKIPGMAASLLAMLIVIGAAGFALYRISEPALDWAENLPESVERLSAHFGAWSRPVRKISEAAQKLNQLAIPEDMATQQVLELKRPDILQAVFSGTQSLTSFTLIVCVIVFFLLNYGVVFRRHVLNILSRRTGQDLFTLILTEIEGNIFAYLVTVSLINICVGIIVGATMALLGLPNPFLWGVMAGLLKFLPYFGVMIGLTILTLVSASTFHTPYGILLPPLLYWLTVLIEGNFITPAFMGNRFFLNPVVVVIWLFFWGWMWGILGALVAFPMLAILKIIAEHIPQLAPLAELLKGRESGKV